MKVNPNRELHGAQPSSAPVKRRQAETESVSQTEFSGAAKLRAALESTEAVRPSEVSKAKRLIADPNYPDAKTIQSVAAQIAANEKLTQS